MRGTLIIKEGGQSWTVPVEIVSVTPAEPDEESGLKRRPTIVVKADPGGTENVVIKDVSIAALGNAVKELETRARDALARHRRLGRSMLCEVCQEAFPCDAAQLAQRVLEVRQ